VPVEMDASTPAAPALELSRVVKSFGAVVALRSGTITMERGSIHALIGENGAGKSTLVKIIAGLYRRDAGEFRLDGEPVDFHTTAQSKAAGIAVIYQEPTLFPDLSVTENIFMGRQPTNRFGRIDRKAMRAEAVEIFQRLGVTIDPDRVTEGLSIADQQIIEIAKAISLDARVLIMDEPTAALSGVEVERLFAVARSLRDEGRALLFISHRFDEVFALCDTVTVMRDGSYIATTPIVETSIDELVRQMVGRDVAELFPKLPAEMGDDVLVVEGLTRTGVFHDIGFTVRAGEIVGLAGLVGAGRTSVGLAAIGALQTTGSVSLRGRTVRFRSPSAAIAAGLAYVTEDRKRHGLFPQMDAAANITMTFLASFARAGWLSRSRERAAAETAARDYHLRGAGLDRPASTLSGGNQQKLLLARCLLRPRSVIILDEPTRGVDVGARAEIYRIMNRLTEQGLGVVMISSDLNEILGMSDRIVVMREGRTVGELAREQASAERVMGLAAGLAA